MHRFSDISLNKLLLLMTLAEFFGDDSEDDDVYATIGYALYAIYLMVVVIILLNLLIAIMNATVQVGAKLTPEPLP